MLHERDLLAIAKFLVVLAGAQCAIGLVRTMTLSAGKTSASARRISGKRGGGAIKIMCNTPAPFSKAASP